MSFKVSHFPFDLSGNGSIVWSKLLIFCEKKNVLIGL